MGVLELLETARMAFNNTTSEESRESAKKLLFKTVKTELLELVGHLIRGEHLMDTDSDKSPGDASMETSSREEDKESSSSNVKPDQETDSSFTLVVKKKKRVCRSAYKGAACDKVDCDFTHPTFCTSCKEKRDPSCKLWHVPTAAKSKVGNDLRRKGPSSKPKGSSSSNDYKALKHKLNVAENLRLKAEVALLKTKVARPKKQQQSYASVVSPPVPDQQTSSQQIGSTLPAVPNTSAAPSDTEALISLLTALLANLQTKPQRA